MWCTPPPPPPNKQTKKHVWSPAESLDSLKQGPKEGDWEFRKMPEQVFGSRSQAAALLLERGITMAWGLDGEGVWIGLRWGVSSHVMPSVGTELGSTLGQAVLCMLSWDGESTGSYVFFSAEKGLAHLRMHSQTELDCLRPNWAQALGGQGLGLFTTTFSVC